MIEVASVEAADKLATELEKLAPLEGQPDPPCAETLANCPNLGAFLKKRLPLEDVSFLVSMIQPVRVQPHVRVQSASHIRTRHFTDAVHSSEPFCCARV